MRFDLLDEYSTLVPFGLGASRNGASQNPAVPAKVAKRGTIVNFTSHLKMLRKLLGIWSKDTHASSKHQAPV